MEITKVIDFQPYFLDYKKHVISNLDVFQWNFKDGVICPPRYGLDDLKFSKMDVGRYSEAATKYHINDSSVSKQLPTVIMLKEGKEFLRRPTVDRNGKLFKFFYTEDNLKAAFDLDNLYNECKSNPSKMKKKTVKEHKKKNNNLC